MADGLDVMPGKAACRQDMPGQFSAFFGMADFALAAGFKAAADIVEDGGCLQDVEAGPHLGTDKEAGLFHPQTMVRAVATTFLVAEATGDGTQLSGDLRREWRPAKVWADGGKGHGGRCLTEELLRLEKTEKLYA